jgi:hypothetical protein
MPYVRNTATFGAKQDYLGDDWLVRCDALGNAAIAAEVRTSYLSTVRAI